VQWTDVDLSSRQMSLVDRWLPGAVVVRDLGWGLAETTVLEVEAAGVRYVVKAGGERDRHIAREIHAHRSWLDPWTSTGKAPVLVRADADAKLLVTRYLAGELVEHSAWADSPDVFRQAGVLLARFHGQLAVEDRDYEDRENQKALELLAAPHRIGAETVERLREEVLAWPAPVATLVPTHGDWQPRNWLVEAGEVRVIDFGRAALRPTMTDFARLAAQDFLRDQRLEAAFLRGYGHDPREQAAWQWTRLREAIGTAVWAYQVDDPTFEEQGHRMIAAALADQH
jgi:thiamine kinase-like enzyme